MSWYYGRYDIHRPYGSRKETMYMTTNQIDAENYKITSRKYIVFYFLFFVTI